MSKGSRIFTVRIPAEMEESMVRAIMSQPDHKNFSPLDTSGWIRDAIQRKLNDIARKRLRRANLKFAKAQLKELAKNRAPHTETKHDVNSLPPH